VSEVKTVDDVVVEDLTRLVTQLSSQTPGVIDAMIRESISSPSTRVLLARIDDKTVGTLTLAQFTVPSGRRAWIEDVVVDESARRQGVGEALVNAAMEIARTDGVRTVDLTSRQGRDDAHRLYEKLGFDVRETNVYRYSLDD
jgi:ribosomal protein S18 acetylase RimI-like enzyme